MERIDEQRVRFDFDAMACPFKLRFEPRMPYAKNDVASIGAANEDRREFIEWLKGLTLKIPAHKRPYIIGETFSVAVPCGELDLL